MIENLFNKSIQIHDHSRTLLEHFRDHGIDWMQACGGKGRCTTCAVIVRDGHQFFQEQTAAENQYAAEGALRPGERLACQARVSGDVVLSTPRDCKLPHLRYSDGEQR